MVVAVDARFEKGAPAEYIVPPFLAVVQPTNV